jgi:hypothetical protein
MARSIKRTMKELSRFDLLKAGDHILTLTCPGCGSKFEIGDEFTLVPIGPGTSEDARARSREGRPYNAVAIPTHWSCATGDEGPKETNE